MAIVLQNYEPALSNGATLFESGTAAIVSGSCTINTRQGIITTASLTTGTAAATTFDLINNKIGANSQIIVTIGNGTNTGGLPTAGFITTSVAGSCTIRVVNASSASDGTALNGTLKINFIVLA